MTDKAVISAYTYRPIDQERKDAGDMPVFVLPDDLDYLFRNTTRSGFDVHHVSSLAILAEKEDQFREYLDAAKRIKARIFSREDDREFVINGNIENLVKWWKDARQKGMGKIGGELAAKAKRAAVAERLKDFTKAEWLDGSIKNPQLTKKYGVSLGALRAYASDKGWGWNRQQAIWRAESRSK